VADSARSETAISRSISSGLESLGEAAKLREQRLWIPGALPGWNELLDAKGTRFKGTRKTAYNTLKARAQEGIIYMARAQLRPVTRAHFSYEFHERDRRRDPSNIAGGAIKIIEDALQHAGILKNDGWKCVAGFSVSFVVDKESQGVMLKIEECA